MATETNVTVDRLWNTHITSSWGVTGYFVILKAPKMTIFTHFQTHFIFAYLKYNENIL